MTIAIRTANGDDAAALADLSHQLGYPVDPAAMRERLARVREARVGEVYVALDAQGSVVGWTHVVPRLHLEEIPFAERTSASRWRIISASTGYPSWPDNSASAAESACAAGRMRIWVASVNGISGINGLSTPSPPNRC